MSVTIEGKLPDFHKTVPALFDAATQKMGEALDHTEKKLEETSPKGHTGRLARKHTRRVYRTAGDVRGYVRPSAFYAPLVEGGTGLYVEHHHPITSSRPGGTLGPFRDEGGQLTYRRRVKGQRGKRFVERTRELEGEPVTEILQDGADLALDRVML